MADLVLEVLNKSNIDVINWRGQSYDNVSNIIGTYKGMQAEIKKKHCKYREYCPYAAHSLSLVGESAPLVVLNLLIFFRLSINFIIFFGIYLSLESHEGNPWSIGPKSCQKTFRNTLVYRAWWLYFIWRLKSY